MAHSASMGVSAQIFAHPNLFAPPVQQVRAKGRHPKCITSLWRVRSVKRMMAYKAEALDEHINNHKIALAAAEGCARALRYKLSDLEASN